MLINLPYLRQGAIDRVRLWGQRHGRGREGLDSLRCARSKERPGSGCEMMRSRVVRRAGLRMKCVKNASLDDCVSPPILCDLPFKSFCGVFRVWGRCVGYAGCSSVGDWKGGCPGWP